MKKHYITPCMVLSIHITSSMICNTGVTGGGMGYGGEDDGTHKPSVKERYEDMVEEFEIINILKEIDDNDTPNQLW